ncbi:hypothetical protein BC831DRAFT_476154 [Entophlyctis helioformis]|nr:hypothetical protein BC831DRAFT_476154 [Entophlyctis helioformis]
MEQAGQPEQPEQLPGWTSGSVIAQACHGVTAVLAKHWHEPCVAEYVAGLESMHKVVLAVKNTGHLDKVATALRSAGVQHEQWIEQPDNIVTAVVTVPLRRSFAVPLFRGAKCELYRK